MKTIEYWEVEESDGDRFSKVTARFSTREEAEKLKSPYRSIHARYMVIFDTVEEFNHNTDMEIRKRAIAKLDREELRVLGIVYQEKTNA